MAVDRFRDIDEDELRAKRVYSRIEKTVKKPKYYLSRQKKVTLLFDKKNTEVMFKITSSCQDIKGIRRILKYISRDGKLALFDQNGNVWKNIDEALYELIGSDYIPYDASLSKRPSKETYNIVFSMKDHKNAPVKKIKAALTQTLRKKYPNNNFMVAMHTDTDNPHCHVIFKSKDISGKRHYIRKTDINEIRKNFALELNNLGVDACATIRSAPSSKFPSSKFPEKDPYRNYRTVLAFGKANFEFKDENTPSFFIKLGTKSGGAFYLWGKELEESVEINKLRVGDVCNFAVVAQKEVKVQARKKRKDGIIETFEMTTHKNIWDVSIKGRSEKKLNPLKEFKKRSFKKISDGVDPETIKNAAPDIALVKNHAEKDLAPRENLPRSSEDKFASPPRANEQSSAKFANNISKQNEQSEKPPILPNTPEINYRPAKELPMKDTPQLPKQPPQAPPTALPPAPPQSAFARKTTPRRRGDKKDKGFDR